MGNKTVVIKLFNQISSLKNFAELEKMNCNGLFLVIECRIYILRI